MELNEAKTILKQAGYELKESSSIFDLYADENFRSLAEEVLYLVIQKIKKNPKLSNKTDLYKHGYKIAFDIKNDFYYIYNSSADTIEIEHTYLNKKYLYFKTDKFDTCYVYNDENVEANVSNIYNTIIKIIKER